MKRYYAGIKNEKDCNCKIVLVEDSSGDLCKWEEIKHLFNDEDNYKSCDMCTHMPNERVCPECDKDMSGFKPWYEGMK